jgi:hypothetical protein
LDLCTGLTLLDIIVNKKKRLPPCLSLAASNCIPNNSMDLIAAKSATSHLGRYASPGWSSDAQPLKEITDVRELQSRLKDRGVNLISEADESSTGAASFMIVDPDGNTILVDQHV